MWLDGSTIGSFTKSNFSSDRTSNFDHQILTSTKQFQSTAVLGERNTITQYCTYKMCLYKFHNSNKTKDKCDLPVYSDGCCIFHSRNIDKPLRVKELLTEIENPGHWLEGAYFNQDIAEANLFYAQLPNSIFEGLSVKKVIFSNSNLEGSIFRSSQLNDVSFLNSNLKNANFDATSFVQAKDNVIDFSNSELGGITFNGANRCTLKLSGITISFPTSINYFLNSDLVEIKTGDWKTACNIYTSIGRRANLDWDLRGEEIAFQKAMTSRHRFLIDGGPMIPNISLRNWVIPSLKSGLKGIIWFFHRFFWGYGYNHWRIVVLMFCIILTFSIGYFYADGIVGSSAHSNKVLNSLLFSVQSFVSMNFGTLTPKNRFCEILGTIQSFIGTLTVSLFLVSLSTKYMRRL